MVRSWRWFVTHATGLSPGSRFFQALRADREPGGKDEPVVTDPGAGIALLHSMAKG